MGDTLITWNLPNWATVGLMSLFFLAVLAFGAKLYTDKVGGGAVAS